MIRAAIWVALMAGAAGSATGAHAQAPAAGAVAPVTAEAEKKPSPETVGVSGSQGDAAVKPAPGAAAGSPASVVEPEKAAPAAQSTNAPVVPAPAPTPPVTSPVVPPTATPGAGPGNVGPITRPLVRKDDEWIYRRTSGTTSILLRQRVTDLNEEGISLITELAGTPDTTTAVYDRQWGLLGSGFNTYTPALAYYAFPLYVGKRWRIDSGVNNFGAGQTGRITGEGVALAFEMVDTAAGRFQALKIQVEIETADPGDASRTMRVRETHWYARNILRAVKVESAIQVANEAPRQEVIELVSFRLD